MKKLVIVLLVVIGLAASTMPLTALGIRQGFLHPQKTWAPGVVYFGARMLMRIGRYQSAVTVLDRAVGTWPTNENVDEAFYWTALCCERAGSSSVAIMRYKSFLAKYPTHRWSAQAQRRLALLEAQGL